MLVLVGVAIAVSAIDANDFRAPIQSYVKSKTGRGLVVHGPIQLKLSLVPTLVLNEVSLSNASWGKEKQMLVAKRIEADLALLPLLQRKFEVRHFAIVEPVVALETDRTGHGNWEFGSEAAAPAGSTPDAGKQAGLLNGVSLADLAVTQGQVNYVDGKSGKVTHIVVDRLALHARDPAAPIAAEFTGRLDDVSMALEGTLGPLQALQQRQWPYPVSLKGEVDGRKTSVSTKLALADTGASLSDIDLVMGTTHFTGEATVSTSGDPRKLSFKLASEALALDELAPGGTPAATGATGAAAKPASTSGPIFKPTPVNFAPLHAVDAQGEITIGQLVLDGGHTLSHVHLTISLVRGRLHADLGDAGAFGGSVRGQIDADASRATPAIALKLDGKGLDLAAVLAAAGLKRETRGGKADVNIDISATGDSPRAWASSASGQVLAQVGKATLINTGAKDNTEVDRLGAAINPFRDLRPSNELDCAVVRLPLRSGIAAIDQSIGLETHEVAVLASGTIDLRNETLDLSIKPRLKRGIPVDVAQFAQLVHFGGPFRDPKMSIDAAGTVATVARIGAAIQTGGLSALGESLLSHAVGDTNACQTALHATAGSRADAARGPKADAAGGARPEPHNESPLEAIGRALGRLR